MVTFYTFLETYCNVVHDNRLLPTRYLVVLIGGDRDEGRLVEDVSAVGRVLGTKSVVFIRFDDVEPRLVLVHRVQDDLEKDEMQQRVLFRGF